MTPVKLPYQAVVRLPTSVELTLKKTLSSALSDAAVPPPAVPVWITAAAGVAHRLGHGEVGGRRRRAGDWAALPAASAELTR